MTTKIIKKLQNSYTTHEQSKRLLELGLPADSADCFYRCEDSDYIYVLYNKSFSRMQALMKYKKEIIPCWSVGRLIEIYHICVSRGFCFHVCFTNLMNEIMYELGNANRNGWLDIKRLEE